jgi:hypothetical protein
MVGWICSRQILTLGHPGGIHAILGFANPEHVDIRDILFKWQVKEWSEAARNNQFKHCQELLAQPDFCLPTTCGYQIVHNNNHPKEEITVSAYFAMSGLGLAMKIENGVGNHFMGGMFTHNTCLPICCNNKGQLTASNKGNNLLIIGWGTSGGAREFSEIRHRAARRNAANALAAAQAGEAAAIATAINARASEAEATATARAAIARVETLLCVLREHGIDTAHL